MRVLSGVDLVSVERFAKAFDRHGDAFAKKFLTEKEQAHCMGVVEKMAGRFAAKEAVLKALGTGFWQNGVVLTDVSVMVDRWGRLKWRSRAKPWPFTRRWAAARYR